MRLLAPIQFIVTCLLAFLIVACGDSTDSAFPKPNCGGTDNPCVEITAFTISPANKTILVEYGQQYTATVFFDDGSQQDVTEQSTWSLDNDAVASISNNNGEVGFAQGLTAGSTLISASYKTATASAQLTVMDEPVEQLIIVPAAATLPVGTSQQYGAFLLLSNKQSIDVSEQVTWQMLDSKIAAINDSAVVMALTQGTTKLDASITHSNDTLLTATADVIVIASTIKEIVITPANGTFPVGTTGTYQASAYYTDGHVVDITKDATWSIADNSIASITESGDLAGFAKALAVGTTQVLASLQGMTGATNATITDAVIRSISINPVAAVVPAGVSVYYQAHALYSDETIHNITRLAAWSSSIPEIGNIQFVNALAGVTSTFSPGVTQISAHFDGLTETVPLTVTAAALESLQISPQNPSVPLGTNGQFIATAYYSDKTSVDVTKDSTWQTSDHQIATIVPNGDSAGFSISNAIGSTEVAVSFADQQVNTTLTVTDAVLESLSLTPAQATVPAGAQQSYQLFGLYSDGSSTNLTSYASWQSSNLDLATINNQGKANALLQGEVDILATYQGSTKTALLTITPAQLTHINVTPKDLSIAVGHQASFIATAFYTDFTSHNINNVAVWSSEDTAIAKVNVASDGGLTTGLSVGTSKITATFNGQSDSGTVEVTSAVLEGISITPVSATIAAGLTQNYQLTATFSDSSKKNVTNMSHWQSSDTAVATISVLGLATSSIQGDTIIQGSYQGMTATATLIVTTANLTTLQITPQNPTEPLGTTGKFSAIAFYSDSTSHDVTQEVTWSSHDDNTVSIITNGITGGYASADKVGNTQITASLMSTTSSTKATVTEAILESLSLTPASASIPAGTTQTYQLFGLFSDGSSKNLTLEASWQTSDDAIATVNSLGITTGIAVGDITVTASYKSEQVIASLSVTDAVVDFITVTPATQELPVNHTARLNTVAHYSNSTTKNINHLATWTVDDDAIAKVNNTLLGGGNVTGISAGIATITAAFSGHSANNITTVTGVTLEKVTISPVDITIAAGVTQQYQLFAIFSDSSSKEVTIESDWQSSDINTVSIDTLGLATSYYEGKVTITGTYQGMSAATSLTVTAAEITRLEISPVSPFAPVGTEDKFTATVFYSDGYSSDVTRSTTWSSSEPSIVSIVTSGPGAGYAKAEQIGISKISADFGGITAETTATVTAATLEEIIIDNIDASITVDNKTSYTAIGVYSDGSFKNIPADAIWLSSDTAIATVEKTGVTNAWATGRNVGVTNITANANGITSNIAKLTVTQAVIESIEITPNSASLLVNTTKNFTAIATYSDGETINITELATWISDNTAVANVITTGSGAGLVSAAMLGTTTITASLASITSNIAEVNVTNKIIDNIQITPNNKSYNVGQTEQYKVTIIYTDYSIKDITAEAQISSDNPLVATFDVNNVMTAKTVGNAELSASYQGVTSKRQFLHVLD